jgi:hypothetical protein
MSTVHRDPLVEAAAIIDEEFARLQRRDTLECVAITAMLLLSAGLLVVAVSQGSPIPFVVGIVAFAVALWIAQEPPGRTRCETGGARRDRLEAPR